MNKKAICVYSTSRSGSTYIGALLANSPNAMHLGEVYAWFGPFRGHHRSYGCSCGVEGCSFLEPIKSMPRAKGLYQCVLSSYNKEYLVDSSKDAPWFFQRFSDVSDLDFYNVVVWKDPKSYAYSKFKRGQFNRCLDIYVAYYKQLLPLLDSYVSVYFDSFDAASLQPKLNMLLGIDAVADTDQMARDNHIFYGSGTFRASQVDGEKLVSDDVENLEFRRLYESDFQRLKVDLDAIRGALLARELQSVDHLEPMKKSCKSTLGYWNFKSRSLFRRFRFWLLGR